MQGGRLVIVCGLPGSGKTTLAVELAAALGAVRLCPDDWMMAAGIDLWEQAVRARIEDFQRTIALDRLASGGNVVIEWGTWSRSERDGLRDDARALGAAVELRFLDAPLDELWRRIDARAREATWGSRPIRRADLDEWLTVFEAPTAAELATYDPPLQVSSEAE